MEDHGVAVSPLEGTTAGPALHPFAHARFVDTVEVGLDDAGRVSLPATFRHAFSDQAIIAPAGDRFLEMWTPATFDLVLQDRRRRATAGLSHPRSAKRLQMAATRASIDKQYRFVIAPRLREKLELTDRIVLAGAGEAIEIYSVQDWELEQEQLDASDVEYQHYEGL